MPRLTRKGVVVNVSQETADRLSSDGWEPAEAEKPKRSRAKKSDNDDE